MGSNGQARVGRRLHPCNDEQRRQCPSGLCHRVRGGITHKVRVFVLTMMRIHQGFQRVQSGQLRFLGSRVAEITPGRIGPELGVHCPVFFVAAFFAPPDFRFGQPGQAAAVTAGQARNLLV